MPSERPPFYDDLGLSLAHAWSMLAMGVRDRRSAFRTPALATIGLDGTPQVRTVVLRACDEDSRTLKIHTDRRSTKVTEIERNPTVALHVYDAAHKLQLRLSGLAHLHIDDAVARAGWATAQPMSRACYAQGPAPGQELGSPTSIPQLPAVPDGEMSGSENFAAITIEVLSIEWLYLGYQGHRRARFIWPDGRLAAAWLAP